MVYFKSPTTRLWWNYSLWWPTGMGWQSSGCTMTCFWISWTKQPKRWAQDFINLSKRHVLLLILRNCSVSMMHVPIDKLSNLHMWIVRQGAPQTCTILSQLHCVWGKIQSLYLLNNILEKLQTRPQLWFLQNTVRKKISMQPQDYLFQHWGLELLGDNPKCSI